MNLLTKWLRGLQTGFGRGAHSLTANPRRPVSGKRRGQRPGVEHLEDRSVPTTFTVLTNADNGDDLHPLADSLRSAILSANANSNIGGPDTIAFNIPGPGVHTISPTSQLPTITDPVIIDGYSQPSSSANTNDPGLGDNAVLTIELDGSQAGTTASGLMVAAGNSTIEGLVVNRFSYFGIVLNTADGNIVSGNFIGTDPNGAVAEGNGYDGILIGTFGGTGRSNGNTIGGLTDAARNVISGNGGSGIDIQPSDGNLIEGNFIGTDATGTVAVSIPTARSGVIIFRCNDNTIGGTTANARNLISGNAGIGVEIYSDLTLARNKVQGNYIGTDVTGTSGLANTQGISDNAGSEIGGLTDIPGTGAGNLISGNTNIGVFAAYGFVKGNLIGTDATGTYAIGNGTGLFAGAETIGGTTAAARNVVSGNGGAGMYLGADNLVQGNYVGTDITGKMALTDITGTIALGNRGQGVFLDTGSNSLIGGTAAGAGNVIAGNGYEDIRIQRTTGAVIQGNYIGVDKTGNIPLSNRDWGIAIHVNAEVTDVHIGGTTAGAKNVIGSRQIGIWLNSPNTSGIVVEGNSIGVGADGLTPISNGCGVGLGGGTSNNTIGGAADGAGNVIANNGTGVILDQYYLMPITTGNAILGNSIYNNVGLGIDINRQDLGSGSDGPNPNDLNDVDSGNNNLQNYPVLTSAFDLSSSTKIQGSLNSTPNATFRVEIFSNTTVDPSGYGEGEHYLGFANVTTDAGGNASFTVTLPSGSLLGKFITATATDAVNNTSEFSLATVVVPNPVVDTTTIVTAANAIYDGNPHGATAVVNPGSPAGDVTFFYTGTGGTVYSSSTPPTSAGTYHVVANFTPVNPDAYNPSIGAADYTIYKKVLTGNATTQDTVNMAKQGKLTITVSNVSGLVSGKTAMSFVSTAEYYITIGTNSYVFIPSTVTTSGSNITITYTMKNSLLASELAAELADNTSAATSIAAGFAIESQNYTLTDDDLTRLFSTSH